MKMKTKYFEATDGKRIYYYDWEVVQPVAIMQIVHGMAEHATRYENFAQYLNQLNISVYATDHRGHGKTAGDITKLGYIGEHGIEYMVDDEYVLKQLVQKEHANIPYFILGHSMGSFITQRFIQLYGHTLAGAILVGSRGKNGLATFGKITATVFEKFNHDKPSPALEKIVFKGYVKNTPFDWLATDNNVVQGYIEDELCGAVFPPSFYHQLIKLLQLIAKPKEIGRVPQDLPILILSGELDPVGLYGRGVKKLTQQYIKNGNQDLEMHLYPKSKHELLNDVEKMKVFKCIKQWVLKRDK